MSDPQWNLKMLSWLQHSPIREPEQGPKGIIVVDGLNRLTIERLDRMDTFLYFTLKDLASDLLDVFELEPHQDPQQALVERTYPVPYVAYLIRQDDSMHPIRAQHN